MERIVLALLTLTVLLGGLTDIVNVKAHTCTNFSLPTKCLIFSIQSKAQVSLSSFLNLPLKLQSSLQSYQRGPSLACSLFLTPPQHILYTPHSRMLPNLLCSACSTLCLGSGFLCLESSPVYLGTFLSFKSRWNLPQDYCLAIVFLKYFLSTVFKSFVIFLCYC